MQCFQTNLKIPLAILFFSGIIFFSGSIYAIYIAGISAKSIWFVTPFGGFLLIVGLVLNDAFFSQESNQQKKSE